MKVWTFLAKNITTASQYLNGALTVLVRYRNLLNFHYKNFHVKIFSYDLRE